jgi:hypothetical protein
MFSIAGRCPIGASWQQGPSMQLASRPDDAPTCLGISRNFHLTPIYSMNGIDWEDQLALVDCEC